MRILLLFLIVTSTLNNVSAQVDSLLILLNKALDEKGVYDRIKLKRLEEYHLQLVRTPKRNLEQQFRILSKLAEEYKTFNYDSAFTSIQRLQQIAYAQHETVRIAYLQKISLA